MFTCIFDEYRESSEIRRILEPAYNDIVLKKLGGKENGNF